jgi:hypothetical protein
MRYYTVFDHPIQIAAAIHHLSWSGFFKQTQEQTLKNVVTIRRMTELKLDYLVDEAPMFLKYLPDLCRLTNPPVFAHYNLPPKKLTNPYYA